MVDEMFSWKKFFKGLVDPVAYFKTVSYILKLCVIILMVYLFYCLGVRIHEAFTVKKPQPSVFNVNDQVGGEVRNSADQKECKFGLFNF